MRRRTFTTVAALVALALPKLAWGAIVSVAPRGADFDEPLYVRTEPDRYVDDPEHHMAQQVLLRFQGEAYRKPHVRALALWEANAPPPPEYLSAYEHVTFWRKRPYRLRTAHASSPYGGIPVRGLSGEAALGFVNDYRQILGVPTAPRHVHVTERDAISDHEYHWTFRQFPPGPEGITCRRCRFEVVIDVRTMRITEIMNTLIDLPERGLPLPTTDGRETRAHYLAMHPDGAEGIPPRPGVLSYAQDRYGDVSLVWEVPGYRIRRQACTASDAYVTWFALDAQNWSFRGFDVADDVYFDLGGEEPHPGMTASLFKRMYRQEDDSHLAYPHERSIDCP